MENDVDYLRRKLDESRKVRGRIAQIARELQFDRRTIDKLSDPSHTPHVTTVDKLLAYFRKADKTAARRPQ